MNKLLDFFLSKDSYPERPDDIKHYETHISHVFLAGDFAYKIKKPVKFDFLDFSSLKKRLFYCKREVALNSRLAKNCYLGVKKIYEKDDKLMFSKKHGCKVFEYLVLIKRFDELKILSNLINDGKLLIEEVISVAKIIANFHRKARIFKGRYYGGYGAIKRDNVENIKEIAPYIRKTLNKKEFEMIKTYTEEFLAKHKNIFSKRKDAEFVKEIHGDLHTKHIVISKPIVIFDCIEFNKRFSIDDVLADIAFLLMDLEFMGRFDLSSMVYRKYFTINKAYKNDTLLRFYKVYRAVVRGKVESFTATSTSESNIKLQALKRAKDYFSLACHYIRQDDKAFNPLIFMGLSGSGKSSVAKLFKDSSFILRSDEIRKEIAGKNTNPYNYGINKGIYSLEMTERTYNKLLEYTIMYVKKGRQVIVDATFTKLWQRRMFLQGTVKAGLNPIFIYFTAPEDLLFKRVLKRKISGNDISDADEIVLKHQLSTFEYPNELPSFRLLKLQNAGTLSDVAKNIEALLQ